MSDKVRLRRLWFQLHKWLGLTLAILIIPISLTGAALVWHDWVDGALNPEREVSAAPALSPAAYAAAARKFAAPDERLLSIGFPHESGAVVATLTKPTPSGGGRPARTSLYLHPADARLLDKGTSGAGAVQVMHVIHGSLMVPGVGRQIVGWVGVAMLLSSLTGLWLWWPLKGGFKRGLRWRRQPETSGNLHHLGGFWIALPLAILSATGAWISFPAFFASLSGDPAGPSPAERLRRMAAVPALETRLTADAALAAARPLTQGRLVTITLPTEKEGKWKLAFAREGGNAEVQVDDRSGAATPPKPPRPETTARLMRRIHDGTGMGKLWQVIIFVGGLIPAALAVTGVLMWLTARRRRRAMENRRTGRTAAAAE